MKKLTNRKRKPHVEKAWAVIYWRNKKLEMSMPCTTKWRAKNTAGIIAETPYGRDLNKLCEVARIVRVEIREIVE